VTHGKLASKGVWIAKSGAIGHGNAGTGRLAPGSDYLGATGTNVQIRGGSVNPCAAAKAGLVLLPIVIGAARRRAKAVIATI